MSRPRIEKKIETRIERAVCTIVTVATLGGMLAGCSDIYFDRRDALALGAGDALAANAVEQMVDPWPAHSGNTNIAFDGQRMQTAIERYRTKRVTPAADSQATSNTSAAAAQNSTQIVVNPTSSPGAGTSSPGTGTSSPGGGTAPPVATAGQ
jgi:hypothetical protein